MRWILRNQEQFLTRPEDPSDLAAKTRTLLSLGRADYGDASTWELSCDLFERALQVDNDGPVSRKSLGTPFMGVKI
jgi:hypothetical protein